jgi:hypothetical protein
MFSKHQGEAAAKVTKLFGHRRKTLQEAVFLFDIHTLFDAHQSDMNPAFATYLAEFAQNRSCYVLSNLNYAETVSRLPKHVRRPLEGVFASAGTEFWRQNELIVRHDHAFSDDIYETVAKLCLHSEYPNKQAPLIDCGSATLRICLAGTRVGRSARQAYLAWEEEHRELDKFIEIFRTRFPDHSICRDTDDSLLVMPNSYSTATVQDHLLRRHKSARLIAYLGTKAAAGYAKPMCDTFLSDNVLSTVSGASDVSQLLSYEMRRMQSRVALVPGRRMAQGA